jgi:hypothetical protein
LLFSTPIRSILTESTVFPANLHTRRVIAGIAGAAVAHNTHPLGRGAQTAHAWLDTLHSRYLALFAADMPIFAILLSGHVSCVLLRQTFETRRPGRTGRKPTARIRPESALSANRR